MKKAFILAGLLMLAASSAAYAQDETETVTEMQTVEADCPLEDGKYLAVFETDSGMFHVNEACDDMGVLTVKDGQMTIHVTLASKKIENLFFGLAADAKKDGAQMLPRTVDEVTYSDGDTEEAYGFDIPVPALDEEFDVAIIGTKKKWYDHKVMVTDVTEYEEETEN